MARIRSLKPEFPISESMGRISREARLCFILLWTLADDAGRLRGHSRALASLLYPFDDDAPGLMDGWLVELEGEGCIRRYHTEGSHYIDIPNWLKHQKIDRPSDSRLPAFSEDAASPREPSRTFDADLGPRTKDHGPRTGREDAPAAPAPARTPKATRLPEGSLLPDDWADWARTEGHHDPQAAWSRFHDHWIAKAGKDAAKQDWQATWRNWIRTDLEGGKNGRVTTNRGRSARDPEAGRRAWDAAIYDSVAGELGGNAGLAGTGGDGGHGDNPAGRGGEPAGGGGGGRGGAGPGEPASLRGDDQAADGLRRGVRPAGPGPERGGGGVPGRAGRLASEPIGRGGDADGADAQIPRSTEAGRDTGDRGGGFGEVASAPAYGAASGDSGGTDDLDIPTFLARMRAEI